MCEGMSVVVNVMLSLMSVKSPLPSLWNLNSDDICMCPVNNQIEFLEFVFNSVYVDLKYNEIRGLVWCVG